jgi:hypothetical protein
MPLELRVPFLLWGPAAAIAATINNHACVGDGKIPEDAIHEGLPRYGGGRNVGVPLVRIEPLLRFVDLL